MVLNVLAEKKTDFVDGFRVDGEIEEERIEEVLAMDVNTRDFYARTSYGQVVKLTFAQVMTMPPLQRRLFVNFMKMPAVTIVHLTNAAPAGPIQSEYRSPASSSSSSSGQTTGRVN